MIEWLRALPGPVTVGMEATLYWEWLATRLLEQGRAVRVAHAFHVKLICQARAMTDPIDERKLGYAATAIIPEVEMALKPCYECARDVSSAASKCPHCGATLKEGFLETIMPRKQGSKLPVNWGLRIAIVTGMLVAYGLFYVSRR